MCVVTSTTYIADDLVEVANTMSDRADTERDIEDEEYRKKLQRLCDQALVESARKKNNALWSYRVKDRLETFRLELVVGACIALGLMLFLFFAK